MKTKTLLQLLFFLFVSLGWSFSVSAQCPVAANCTPANAPAVNHAFGMGILNVSLGSINNTTAGVTDGYQNYSCTLGTNLSTGTNYPISVRTNANADENVRVWIDYDNNGSFDPVTELAFSSNNKKLHTGTITPPATAVTGQPLRMRVSADYFAAPVPTPCSSPQYSQVEDYAVTISANNNAPAAAFSAAQTTTCTGIISFTDQTQNLPTSWTWNFGDGNTSTQQNPTHTYTSPGTYTVTLIVCNSISCDTLTKTNYINFTSQAPVAAQCTPVTSTYCCGYGITSFSFHNLTNTSANASVGYEDFTCTQRVTVTEGSTYQVSLTTGTANNHDTRIYIDLNNNGIFGVGEMVWQALDTINPSGTITIPGTQVVNTPLRMRVISDFAGSSFNACTGVTHGQAEDYTITVSPFPVAPIANFTSASHTLCDSIISFRDQTNNSPSRWKWYFGDGDSASVQNPVHEYTAAGTYTVTLISCNNISCDTIVKTNYVNFDPADVICRTYYMPASGSNSVTRCNGYLYDFNGPNQNVGVNENGRFTIHALGSDRISLAFSSFDIGDGVFHVVDGPDLSYPMIGVYRGDSLPNGGTIISTGSSLTIEYFSGSNAGNPGFAAEWNCVPVNSRPQADFVTYMNCSGVVRFADRSTNVATSWLWDFGDGSTSNIQNPVHTFPVTRPAQYDVTLIVCNSFGCDTITKQNNIVLEDPCLTYCVTNQTYNRRSWINRVIISDLNHQTGIEANGYGNHISEVANVMQHSAYELNISTSGNFAQTFINVWIDYNKDGVFQSSEQIINNRRSYTFYNFTPDFTSRFTIPDTVPYGRTRMRVMLSPNLYSNTDPCTNNAYEIEDYTLNIIPNTIAPRSNFFVRTDQACDGIFKFSDLSINLPTSWIWNFGDGNTSTLQNPEHTYSSPGTYTVSLISCNNYGCDTITRQSIVVYSITSNNCNFSLMPTSGTLTSAACEGTLFDSGGANGNYGASESGIFIISPAGAQSITLDFVMFDTETGLDQLDIYDGPSTTSPLIGRYSGSNLPNGGTITAGRSVTIRFQSSSSVNKMGWAINWSCSIPSPLPIAKFKYTSLECNEDVYFTDLSTNGATSWLWDFGDGTTSTLQNPTHHYFTSNPNIVTYIVTLQSCNANGCTTYSIPLYLNFNNGFYRSCPQHTAVTCCNSGISRVQLNKINHATGNATEGYIDNGCSIIDTLYTGSTFPIWVYTYQTTNNRGENVQVWIDFNQDGEFTASERVMHSQGSLIHQGQITIPSNAVMNVPLRMRVNSQSTSFGLPGPCGILRQGQAEDYAVVLVDPLKNKNKILTNIFTLYPNPSSGLVTVKRENSIKQQQLEVLNMLGQQVHKEQLQSDLSDQQLDLSHLPKGIYVVRLMEGTKVSIQKLVLD